MLHMCSIGTYLQLIDFNDRQRMLFYIRQNLLSLNFHKILIFFHFLSLFLLSYLSPSMINDGGVCDNAIQVSFGNGALVSIATRLSQLICSQQLIKCFSFVATHSLINFHTSNFIQCLSLPVHINDCYVRKN